MLPLLHITTSLVTQSPLSRSSLPGNVNFDPLNLAKVDPWRKEDEGAILFEYREAELKHSRLAMLAAVAYPAQETLDPLLSERLDMPNALALQKLSPSLVNGDLSSSVLIFFLGLGSGLELFKMNLPPSMAGDYGWRVTPHEDGTKEFEQLREGEIWNGRLAMIAVAVYVVQEAVTKMPVLMWS